jgi:hypothetical protein
MLYKRKVKRKEREMYLEMRRKCVFIVLSYVISEKL